MGVDKVFRRWGKTWRRRANPAIRVHRVEHHCLDVLSVADALLMRDPGLLRSLARVLGGGVEDARTLLRWCCLVHDLGKLAVGFQAKSPEGWSWAYPERSAPGEVAGCAHDMVGFIELRDALETDFVGSAARAVTTAAACAAFHHGRPRRGPGETSRKEFGDDDRDALETCLARAAELVGLPAVLASPGVLRASWLLTGIVSLCDGLGSEVSDRIMEGGDGVPPAWFEDRGLADVAWADYLRLVAAPMAARVVAEIGDEGFCPLPRPPHRAATEVLADMVGVERRGFVPSPLQAAAGELPMDGQFLAVIEDMTGAGKTEASALLVRRAVEHGVAEGGFWGLPTMATANGLHARLLRIAPLLHGGPPSLVLAHGGRDEVALFRRSLRGSIRGRAIETSPDAEATDGATCLGWLTEGAHRALLAHCGVGTIDQALMAGLNSYHCGIRWVGLHRKVLVADEVHAADAGMLEILVAVLRHHAMLGGSAILMSATLPSATRGQLLEAFREGAGFAGELPPPNRVSYPLLSVLDAGGLRQDVRPTRADRSGGELRFARMDTADQAADAVRGWSEAGRCAVWFRNTVRDATAAWRTLREAGTDAILFHSRFTRARRAEIETEVMRVFGPGSTPEQRRGRVLVATQVAEQSLDLDFDEAVVDLAPADLLLQRLGRYRRHVRDAQGSRDRSLDVDGRVPGRIVLLSPDPGRVRDADWLLSTARGTSFVYPDVARLWRSAQLLLDPSLIPERKPGLPRDAVVPHLDCRPLVEAVYPPDDSLRDAAPLPLRASHDSRAAVEDSQRGETRRRVFAFRDGYLAEAQAVEEAHESPQAMVSTRSGDGGSLHLAIRDGGGLRWFEAGGMAASSVPTRQRVRSTADGADAAAELASSLRQVRGIGEEADRAAREARLLEDTVRPPAIVVVELRGGHWRGRAEDAVDGSTLLVSYSPETGIEVRKRA